MSAIIGDVGSEQAKYAKEVHSKFLLKYGITAEQVPLLQVTGSARKAFTVACNGVMVGGNCVEGAE